VMKKLTGVRDALYGEGSVHLLEYALRTGGAETVETFLGNLPAWYLGPDYMGDAFLGDKALLAAVEADRRSGSPFEQVVRGWQAIIASAETTKSNSQLADRLKGALQSYCKAPIRQFDDLTALAKALETVTGVDGASKLRDELSPVLVRQRTFDPMVGYSKACSS